MSIFVRVTPDLSRGNAKILQVKTDKRFVQSQGMILFRQEQRRHNEVSDRSVISAADAWKAHRKRPWRAKRTTAKPLRPHAARKLLHTKITRKGSSNAPSTPSGRDDDKNSSGCGLSSTCVAHMVQRMCLYIDVLTDNFIDGYFASARNSKSLAGAANDRFFLVAGVDTEQEMGEIMRKHFVELRETGRSDLSGPIPAYDINNGKSKKVLGVSYRSLEDTIVDTVESLKAVVSNQQIGVEASL